MTDIVTALGVGPLRWKDVILTAVSPTVGYVNIYNTLTANAPLSPTLPQVAGGTGGGMMLLGKDAADTSTHPVTFSCYGTETFYDGSTQLVIADGGQSRVLQTIDINGVLKWIPIGGIGTPELLSAATAQSVLPLIIALG